MPMEAPSVLGRIVRHIEAGRLLPQDTLSLVSEDGALPVSYVLGTEDFQPGDLIEIRLVRREGAAGEKARVLTPAGRPLTEPVPIDYRAQVRLPAEIDPFESE
jgi:hypothetical protein